MTATNDNVERVRRMHTDGLINAKQAECLLESLGKKSAEETGRGASRFRPGWPIAIAAVLLAAGALLLGGTPDPTAAQDVAATLNQPGSIAEMSRSTTNIAAIGLLLVIPFLILAFTYNRMIDREEAVFSAWSDVESTYQRRSDLIPRLVESVSKFLKHEEQAIETVASARSTALRSAIDELLARHADSARALGGVASGPADEAALAELSARDAGLRAALGGVSAVAEDYPELRASDQFLELQSQLEGTENRINVARQRFNTAAEEFNASIRRLPGSLLAGIGNFQRKAYFKADAGSQHAKPLGF